MPNRPLLLGHRGARGVQAVQENTLSAFDLALTQGCDGFEFDVRLAGDGQAVVCHDAEIRNLEISRSSTQKLQLPLLGEVLTRYASRAFLDIELKVTGLEAVTVDLLRKHEARGFVVSSFFPNVLQTVQGMDANVPLGLLCETRAQFSRWAELPVEYVIPHYKLLRSDLVAEIKAAGRKTLVWTVNTPAEMRRLADWGVDGVISDNPEEIVRTLGRGADVQNCGLS
jgi:glycerophosphoryl diester phosphodiesterase